MRAKVAGSSSRTFLSASRPLMPPSSFGSLKASLRASRNAADSLSRAALCRPRLPLACPAPKRVAGLGLGFAMQAADYHHSQPVTTDSVAAESPLAAAELAALTVFEEVMSAAIPAGQSAPLRRHQ